MKVDWSGHQSVDPFELQMRFSDQEGMNSLESITLHPSDEDLERLERVKGVLDELPPCEADFVELYFFRNLRQTDIANIFGVSQPTVCYRLKRAAERIQYLLSLPDISMAELSKAMYGFLDDEKDAKIMVLMFETTCQSEVAKRLGESQGLVRHRFIRSIGRMKENGNMDQFVKLFNVVAENLNILREVRRASIEEESIIRIVD